MLSSSIASTTAKPTDVTPDRYPTGSPRLCPEPTLRGLPLRSRPPGLCPEPMGEPPLQPSHPLGVRRLLATFKMRFAGLWFHFHSSTDSKVRIPLEKLVVSGEFIYLVILVVARAKYEGTPSPKLPCWFKHNTSYETPTHFNRPSSSVLIIASIMLNSPCQPPRLTHSGHRSRLWRVVPSWSRASSVVPPSLSAPGGHSAASTRCIL